MDELFERRRKLHQIAVIDAVVDLLSVMGNPAGASLKLDDERFIVVGTKEEITQLLGD
jgi:hypothetical protein